MSQMKEVWTQIFRMQNQDEKSSKRNCERNIWLGLQHLVQMSLLWRIWTHCNELCETSHEKKGHYQRCFICTELSHLAKNYMNIGRLKMRRKQELKTSESRWDNNGFLNLQGLQAWATMSMSLKKWVRQPFLLDLSWCSGTMNTREASNNSSS